MIHFGYFIRKKRLEKGWDFNALARAVGLTTVRLHAVEKMPKPAVYDSTFSRLAIAFDMTWEELDKAWQTTQVEPPPPRAPSLFVRFKLDPEHDERLRAVARSRGGISRHELARQIVVATLTPEKAAVERAGGAPHFQK